MLDFTIFATETAIYAVIELSQTFIYGANHFGVGDKKSLFGHL